MIRQVTSLYIILLLTSCNIQKRQYRNGFYAHWKQKSTKEGYHHQKTCDQLSHESDIHFEGSLVASGSKQILHKPNITKMLAENFNPDPDSCDVILFKDGREIRATILEVGPEEIKYKKCRVNEGPLFVVRKSEVFRITYKTGSTEVFQSKANPEPPRKINVPLTRKNSRPATKALIFSLMGLYPFIFFIGIAGTILATIHLQHIRNDPEKYGGEKKAKVAQWVGILTAIIGATALAAIIIDSTELFY